MLHNLLYEMSTFYNIDGNICTSAVQGDLIFAIPWQRGSRERATISLTVNIVLCIPIYIQQDATLHSLFISGNYSTCYGWYLHPSSGAHTTVFTAYGICHTVTATCRYRGGVGTAVLSLPR